MRLRIQLVGALNAASPTAPFVEALQALAADGNPYAQADLKAALRWRRG